MTALGLLALGGIVGFICVSVLRETKDWSDQKKILTTFISAIVSGASFTFLEYLMGTQSRELVSWYPVGVILALLWGYLKISKETYKDKPWIIKLHIGGLILFTILVAVLLLSEDVRNLLPK